MGVGSVSCGIECPRGYLRSLPKEILSDKGTLSEKFYQVCVWSHLVIILESDARCNCSSSFGASSSRIKLQTIVQYSDVKQV